MKMKLMLVVVLAIPLTGCVRSNLSELVGKMGNDNATVAAKINTIYGTGYVIRSNPTTNQDVTISPDGTVTIKSK